MSGPLSGDAIWKAADLNDPEARDRAIAFADDVMERSGERHLRHDLQWALAGGGNGKDRLIALSLECGDALGFGLLIRQERPLPFQIGELTYYRHPITRFHLWSAPLIAGPKPGSERWNELAIGFLAALEDRLQSPGTAHRH